MDIQALLDKWKPRLGLNDWNIVVSFKDRIDMQHYPAKATISANIQHADIRLLVQNDRQASDPGDADVELDLVHELVHVRLWAIDPDDAKGVLDTCREQAIEWLAKALVNTDRLIIT